MTKMLIVQSLSMPKLLQQQIRRELPNFKLSKYCFFIVCIFLFKCLGALVVILYLAQKIPSVFDTIFKNISIKNEVELLKRYPEYMATGATIFLLGTFILEYYLARKFYLEFNDYFQLYLINKKFTKVHPRKLVQFSRTAAQHVFYGLRGELELIFIVATVLLLLVGIFFGGLYHGIPVQQCFYAFGALGIVIGFLCFCIFQCSDVDPLAIENENLNPEIINLPSLDNKNSDTNDINYYRAILMTFFLASIGSAMPKMIQNDTTKHQAIKNAIEWAGIIGSVIMVYVGAKVVESPAKANAFFLCLQSIENCWWGEDNPNEKDFIIDVEGTIFANYKDIEFEDFTVTHSLLPGKIYNFDNLSEGQFKGLRRELTGTNGASDIVRINDEPISKAHLESLIGFSMNDKIDKSRTIWENIQAIDPGIDENTFNNLTEVLGHRFNPYSPAKFNGTEDKFKYLLLTTMVAAGSKSLVVIEYDIAYNMENKHWKMLEEQQKKSGCIVVINNPKMQKYTINR